jgi:SAM-dependent methyltransferase
MKADSRWEQLGDEDPLWAILSANGKEHGGWDPDEFFLMGENDVEAIYLQAQAVGLRVGAGRALDFGCGVGRLSLALARRHEHVTGVDVAESMIARARAFAANAAVTNVTFVANRESLLPLPSATVDFALSLIVLQHLPPPMARRFIGEMIRTLRPGAALVFQLPGELKVASNSSQWWKRWIMGHLPNNVVQAIHKSRSDRSAIRNIPMHGVSRGKVISFVEAHGAAVVGVIQDDAAGEAWTSYRYFCQANAR